MSNIIKIVSQVNNLHEHMNSPAYIQLNLDALKSNFCVIHSLLDKQVKVFSMVNGNAYRHSITPEIKHTCCSSAQIGEFIGVGSTYFSQGDVKITIVPIEYSPGFSRSLISQGRVLIHGFRLLVTGKVNMKEMAIDIPEISQVIKVDAVTLLGHHGDLDTSVISFAELGDQLNY